MKDIIAIIGCGATAIAFIKRYLDNAASYQPCSATIYLFEQRQSFGAGAAYEDDVSSNLLNTKTSIVSPYPQSPGHFKSWLEENPDLWRSRFPDFIPVPDSFAPRPLFGMYLQSELKRLILLGASLGCNIVLMNAEVKDVEFFAGAERILTRCGAAVLVDKVFLFCGAPRAGNSTKYPTLGVSEFPYPIKNLIQKVEPLEKIAIIGARLSAIDTVIGLIENGHRGLIRIHSRSGYFPMARGSQEGVRLRFLTRDAIEKIAQIKGALTFFDLQELFLKELAFHDPGSSFQFASLKAPPVDIVKFIEDELVYSARPRVWQAILYATNEFVELIWRSLSESDQIEFMAKYFSMFMAYRVSVPAANLRKILEYLKDGKLEFVAGPLSISGGADSAKPIVASGQVEYAYDRLIFATGLSRSLEDFGSDLILSLLSQRAIRPHPMGGVFVDPETYRVEGLLTKKRQIYAVGEIIVGQHFFTSALDINGRHAVRCADALFKADAVQEPDRNSRLDMKAKVS